MRWFFAVIFLLLIAPPPASASMMLMENWPFVSVVSGTAQWPVIYWSSMPSWTPDGRIIHVSGNQIKIKDDAGIHQVGNLPWWINPLMPTMARDGTILFSAIEPDTQPDANQHLWVMQSDGSGLHEIGTGMAPVIAPSGRWLAFANQINDPYHRYLMRMSIDGSNVWRLTDASDPNWPDAMAPSISPDERTIAIFSGKEADRNSATQSIFTFGYRDIALISATGGPRRKITNSQPVTTQAQLEAAPDTQLIVADDPGWTPDGKQLIFSAIFKGPQYNGTWIVNADGTGAARYYTQSRGLVRVPLQ